MQVRALEGCFHVDIRPDTLLKLMNQQNFVKFIFINLFILIFSREGKVKYLQTLFKGD